MIVSINIHVSVERQRHCRELNNEQVPSEEQVTYADDDGDRKEKIQRIVVPIIEIVGRDHVVSRIMGMVKLHMIFEKPAAESTMAEVPMEYGLTERHQ